MAARVAAVARAAVAATQPAAVRVVAPESAPGELASGPASEWEELAQE
jgi:hypothetical protein